MRRSSTASSFTSPVSRFVAAPAFAAAVEAVGLYDTAIADGTPSITSLESAGTFEIVFGPGRPDGVGAVRDLGYDLTCECFAYLNAENHPLR